jgi:hypothetical protein
LLAADYSSAPARAIAGVFLFAVLPLAMPTGVQAQFSGGTMSTGNANEKFAAEHTIGAIEAVHRFYGPMPTGVTVANDGRIFINFPKWGDDVIFTVGVIKDGKVKTQA